jgi:hypothetical protein
MGNKRNPSLYDILGDAMQDIAEHGYDSETRIAYWANQLRKAAEKMFSRHDANRMLRDSLRSIYQRMVEKGQINKYHFGVDRFTLERIKPKLRAELDRRIMASANLIKLNREAAIQKTLHRFQGWSTSIPSGGIEHTGRGKSKATIYKNISQLSFEDRRLTIDQGYKLISNLNEIIATDSGAIAAEWNSHWRQAGYNYRKDHKVRDKKIYTVRGNWAIEKGLMKSGKAGYTDEITQPGEEVYCRCYYRWIYALSSIPKEMLTDKGASALAAAKKITRNAA